MSLPAAEFAPFRDARSEMPGGGIDRPLAAFEPIALAEMDGVALMNRVDSKYVFSDRLLADLLSDLSGRYRVLEIDRVRRHRYDTLYFDTPECRCFSDHLRGRPNRYKFRTRRYGSSGVAYFEVKQKSGRGRTLKRRVAVSSIDPHLQPEAVALATDCYGRGIDLRPHLSTHFFRITLVSMHAAERVTIDTELMFGRDGQDASAPGVVIAEIKQERDDRGSLIRQSLRDRGVRPLRVSKYCLGATLLNPALKSNLFKPKLLKLRACT